MSKISISLNDYTYDRIFYGFNGNKSNRASELMLKGQDIELGERKGILVKLNHAEKHIKDLTEEIAKLKSKNGLLKARIEEMKDKEMTDGEKFAEAYLNRGLDG